MSPEQIRGSNELDKRADVYAFGVILYEAATGKQPFEAEAFTELAIKIATTEPIAPKQLRPDLPKSLERLIQWAMAKNRDQRIPSIDALIAELEPFASEHGFRGEMTIAHAEQPRVAARSERSRTPPNLSTNPAPMLDTLGNRSSPAMRSQVEIDSVPIKPLLPRWLPAAAAGLVLIALMAGGYFAWSSKSVPAAASASAPPPPALSAPKPPVAAALAPTAEAEPHRMQPQAPAPSPAPEHKKKPEAGHEAARQPSAAAARTASPARDTDKRAASAPVEPRTVSPAEKPAPRPAARQAGQDGFRAGTPRGEDF
jgi:serine/threonine-protein kinase